MNYTLIVSELGDSVKEHWQNYWLTKYETSKVIQNDGTTCFVRLVAEPQLGNYGY
jgi:predicted alpha/beta hydrolase family esterase